MSWQGLTGNRNFDETFHYLYKTNLDDINDVNFVPEARSRILVPDGLCKVYEGDLSSTSIQFNFKSAGNRVKYFVYLADPSVALPFQLPYSLLTGDQISITLEANASLRRLKYMNI